MKNKKVLTFVTLTAAAAGIIHIANKIVAASAQLKTMLDFSNHNYYNWKLGNVYYTKRGNGTPVLLIHDTTAGGSGYEWIRIEEQLAMEHTVYTLDLLGCGRSDKNGITYTNFLFVQLLCDFTKDIIGEKTDVIASGLSSSFALMSCLYDQNCFNKLILVNPTSMSTLAQNPSEKNKLFKFIIDTPIFGTLIYHMIVSRETIDNDFADIYYYNPFHVDNDIMDAYYEAAHKGGCYAKSLYSSLIANYLYLDVRRAVGSVTNPIYILEGEDEINGASIVKDYCSLNSEIQASVIRKSKHFPHIENSDEFLDKLGLFL